MAGRRRRGTGKVESVCANCAQTFITRADRAEARRYCSRKCWADHKAAERRICLNCRREVVTWAGRVSTFRCCSASCLAEWRAKTDKPLVVDDTTWAYFAGFFDGEGSVSVVLNRGNIYTSLSITNTYRPVLDELARIAGVSTGVYVHTRARENRRIAFVFVTRKQRTIKMLLEKMLPYLREKRERALLALDYIGKRNVGGTRRPYNEDELGVVSQMHMLNAHKVIGG